MIMRLPIVGRPQAMDELAAKYTRALDQLKKQGDEVSALLAAGKRLEAEKQAAQVEAAEARTRCTELETHAAKLVARNSQLEEQARALQQRLQRYLDSETDAALMRSRQAGGAEPQSAVPSSAQQHREVSPPRDSLLTSTRDREAAASATAQANRLGEQLRAAEAQVAAMEEAHKAATTAAERFKEGVELLQSKVASLQQEGADLRRVAAKERSQHEETVKAMRGKERALEDVIQQLRTHQSSSAAEASRMAEVESKAMEGVRAEWLSAIAECERLGRLAENAEVAAEEARSEHARVVSQLEAQRTFINESNELSSKEMRALRTENDILLDDLKAAVEERDAARAAAAHSADTARRTAEAKALTASSRAARLAVGPVTVDSAIQTQDLQDAGSFAALAQQGEPDSSPAGVRSSEAEAMADLEAAVLEWKEVAEHARNELASARGTFDEEVRHREQESLTIGRKAQEVAEKLRAAYAEIDMLYSKLQQQQQPSDIAPLPRVDEEPNPRGRGASSALERLAGNEDERSASLVADASDLEAFIEDAMQLSDDALTASVQAHYLATSPAGIKPTADELENAAATRPVVRCARFRHSALNELLARLGGLRHLAKAMRSELWATFARVSARATPDQLPADAVAFRPKTGSGPDMLMAFEPEREAPSTRVSAAVAAFDTTGPRVASASVPSRASTPTPPPPRDSPEGQLGDDDVEKLLAENAATLAALSGQMQWHSTRLDAFRGSIDKLRQSS